MTRITPMLGSAERRCRELRQNSQNQQNESPKLKLAPSPRSLTATLAALPSISEIPFLDSVYSVQLPHPRYPRNLRFPLGLIQIVHFHERNSGSVVYGSAED